MTLRPKSLNICPLMVMKHGDPNKVLVNLLQIYIKTKIHKLKNNYRHSEKGCRDKLMLCKINLLVRALTFHKLIPSKEEDLYNNLNKGYNLKLCKLIQHNHLFNNNSRLKYLKIFGVRQFHNFRRINSKWFNSLNFNNNNNNSINSSLYINLYFNLLAIMYQCRQYNLKLK